MFFENGWNLKRIPQTIARGFKWLILKVNQQASSPQAHLWLAGIFLMEIFLIFPMDLILATYSFRQKQRAYSFAMIATAASTVGSLAGYFMGKLAWDQLGHRLILKMISAESLDWLLNCFATQQKLVLFLAAALPLPFKAVTITAGFCNVPLMTFLTTIFLSRTLRFFVVSFLAIRSWNRKKNI